MILLILVNITNELLTPNSYTKFMMRDMYKMKDNVDLVFLGASHTYLSFNPEVFDKELDINSFNLGSSAQSIEGTYYLFKEFLKRNYPQTVIMEVTYYSYVNILERQYKFDYILMDYYRESFNKYNYLFHTIPPQKYAEALIPCYRNRFNFSLQYIIDNLQDKLRADASKYVFKDTLNEYYQGKGFVYSNESYNIGNIGELNPLKWDETLVIDKNIEYLKKITELCEEKGIEIIWITAPIQIGSMIELGNYEEIHNYFSNLANEYNVKYYDFNYAKNTFLPRDDNKYYYDPTHMNGEYSKLFSKAVCSLLNCSYEEINENGWFYNDWDGLFSDVNYITNAWLEMDDSTSSNEVLLNAFSNSGKDIEAEYQFDVKYINEDEYQVLQDYSEIDHYDYQGNIDDVISFRVNVRPKGSNEKWEQYDEITIKS